MAIQRDEIVAAAMELADEQGADALTMKAVAGRLGPYSPMALYRHVSGKEEIVDRMLDAAIAQVPIAAGPGPDWRADLAGVATATRQMIKDHPWYAWLVHTRPPIGPHTMRRTEFLLRVLTGGGLPVRTAMTFAALIDRHIFGSALQEAQEARFERAHGIEDDEQLLAALGTVHDLAAADGGLPLLTSWLAQPTASSMDEQFELGLGFILDGIAAAQRGAAPRSSASTSASAKPSSGT
jgi:AcrR family transcriptional regulator